MSDTVLGRGQRHVPAGTVVDVAFEVLAPELPPAGDLALEDGLEGEVKPLSTRSNHIEQYGSKPDNYEITYIMHNQQPWAKRSDKPCLVTYNPNSPIDERKILKKRSFQHIVHDVRHVAWLVGLFRVVQGRRRT